MVFKKSFLFASLVLATVLNIQAVFAMEAGNEEPSLSISKVLATVNKRLGQATDLMDEINGSDLPSLTVEQSITPFFKELTDDNASSIFFQLCNTKQAIEDLASIALTCRKGYQLTQNPQLWDLLKKVYFGHLPDEYLATLIKGKKEQGPLLARSLLQQYSAYQLEEMAQLEKILSKGYYSPLLQGDDSDTLIEKLDAAPKNSLLNKLKIHEKSLSSKTYLERYFKTEEILDEVNTTLLTDCLTALAVGENLNLKGAITRLSSEAVRLIIEKVFLTYNNAPISVSLACNNLRWMPDEIFKISKMETLDLRNNKLTYLPPSLEYAKENIKRLYLGNFKSLGDTCACCDWIGRQTTGNSFEVLPPPILTLSELEGLEMGSVGLKEFPEVETYTALPKLSFLNVKHNALTVLPSSTFEGRQISVRSFGNPTGLLTLDGGVWGYRFRTYVQAPPARALQSCIDVVHSHPYIFGSLALGLCVYSFIDGTIPQGGF